MKKEASKFTSEEVSAAREMGKYENQWIAVSKTSSGRETVVGSGDRITDAKEQVVRKGLMNVTYRKIPSAKKVFIA